MNKGYWVVRANVFNMDEYSEYVKLATDIIKKYKGKFLIRGGNQIEFESYQDALNCYNSREYQSAKKFVRNSSKRLVAVVEGLK